ncbi:MAG: V-type ATP synthase subunit D [Candidatus Bathyarchaeota archaeon]|nr:MAG: V-type ATP synthase subunit D [Candidatus Bathyarchaeota archaeon]
MTVLSAELAAVHPTRLELVKLKRRKALAEGIIDILNKDLEALMTSLFELLKAIRLLRMQSRETLNKAYNAFLEAEMISGSHEIEEVSLSVQPMDFHLIPGTQNGVLGISLPTFQIEKSDSRSLMPRYSMLDTPAIIDEAIAHILELIPNYVAVAEKEASIRTLLEVISVKKRQVNRLQYKVLPQLDATIRYIELILEETERQDAVRVRVLQRKRKERAMQTR